MFALLFTLHVTYITGAYFQISCLKFTNKLIISWYGKKVFLKINISETIDFLRDQDHDLPLPWFENFVKSKDKETCWPLNTNPMENISEESRNGKDTNNKTDVGGIPKDAHNDAKMMVNEEWSVQSCIQQIVSEELAGLGLNLGVNDTEAIAKDFKMTSAIIKVFVSKFSYQWVDIKVLKGEKQDIK